MKKACFTKHGVCLIGSMKGVRASKMRKGWVEWAKKEIDGFDEQWQKAMAAPKEQTKPEGRTYILKRWTPKK